MKVLMIGGTGTISMAVTRGLAGTDWEVYLLNRGSRNTELPESVHVIQADINQEKETAEKLKGMEFDVVCEFIGYVPEQLERDFRLFNGRTKQYMFISSASAYQKPPSDYRITESTPLFNPYSEYAGNKIACEEFLMKKYREDGFPITIIRPSSTYDERSVRLGACGSGGSWQVLKRMLEGKPVIVAGDGNSLWTMTHNSDFAKGFIGLMGNVHAIGEAYQITSDESLTWNQIYKIVADCLGVEFKPYYVSTDFLVQTSNYGFRSTLTGDKANTVVFDNSKLKRAVPDFRAAVRFDVGVRKSIEYVLSHKECQREDPEFDEWCDRVIEVLEKAKKEIRQFWNS